MGRKPSIVAIICCIGSICLLLIISTGCPLAASSEILGVSPEVMDINTFFSGGELTITGSIPSPEDVVIEIAGKDSKNSFDLKGRIGPFWMTKGTVHLENIPELYLVLLPNGNDWEKKIRGLDMGLKHLEKRVSLSGSIDVPPDTFSMFTELKEDEGLYNVVPEAVNYTSEKDGMKLFSAVYRLPALIGTGTYDITATRISKEGEVVDRIASHFRVRKIGFVKLIDDLSSKDRILYGVTAVVIAIIAGLAMGFLFKQSGGSH